MELLNRLRENAGRFALVMLLSGVLALGIAACDSGTSGGTSGGTSTTPDTPTASTGSTGSTNENDLTPTAATSGAPATAVGVTLKEWAVDLGGKTDLTAGSYNFNVTNGGQFGHDLVIQDSGGNEVGRTPVFKQGDPSPTLPADLKAGTYKFFCDVPGHAGKGMQTEVTVK